MLAQTRSKPSSKHKPNRKTALAAPPSAPMPRQPPSGPEPRQQHFRPARRVARRRVQQQQQTTRIQSYLSQRKRTAGRNMWLRSSTGPLLTVLMILLCDSRIGLRTLAQSGGDLSPQQQGVQSNQPRFLEEPQDTQVLVGQPADLACAIDDRRGNLFWFRDDTGLNLGAKMFQAYAGRFSLPALDAALQARTPAGPANYSLHIKSVSIKDDALFYCILGPSNGQHQHLSSRKARLSVIQPPSKLDLQAFELAQDDSDREPLRLHSSGQPDYLMAQEQARELATVNLPAGSGQSTETLRLVVRRGMRVKLECQTDLARPHAELVWLDSQQRILGDQPQASAAADDQDTANSSSYAKQFFREDSREPKLATTIATYTFTVERHHSEQLFSCQVKHPGLRAAAAATDAPPAAELRRQVRLEVQWEPEVEIEREPAHRAVSEFQPVRFHCRAQAWPSQLSYSWFIDDEPVLVNGSQAHLYIERATRQLHLRAIKCVAQNSVGQGSAVHRLVLNYGPSFVSHLLLSSSATSGAPAPEQQQQQQQRPLGQAYEFGVAKQLADSFDEGQNVVLRCDFDANPRPQQVSWFRMSTDYLERKEVSPAEADELMSSGYGRQALFQQPDGSQQSARQWAQLDYEQMSQELMQEMAECYGKMKQANASCQLDELPSHSNSLSGYIQEPLRWSVHDAGQDTATAAGSPDEESTVLRLSILPAYTADLAPLNVSQTATASLPIQRRESILSTSTITLTRANLDSVGRYICQARSGQAPSAATGEPVPQVSASTPPSIARALHLVLRRGPRLISASVQYSSSLSRLQVECLAQVHTQLDNTFIWSKNGQIIDMMNGESLSAAGSGGSGSQARAKVIYNVTQYSPDLLLARSILHIEGADAHDFGKYNCTVLNSIDSNQMMIELRAPDPTGIVFNLMASLTLGSILLLVATMSLLIVCVPRRGLHSKCAADSEPGTQSGRDSQQSRITKPSAAELHYDKNAILRPSKGSDVSSGGEPESIYGSSSRQRNLALANRSAKFSAIHESLENKLQLGSTVEQQTNLTVKPELAHDTGHTTDTSGAEVDQPAHKRVASVSELEKSSFLVRLVARLLMKSKQQNVRSRPVISSPINEPASHQSRSSSSLIRAKNALSSSLDMLADVGESPTTLELAANSGLPENGSKQTKNTLGHISESMVSSKANLIQDSTTASDGTASSRSSSSQGQSRDHHAQLAAQEVAAYTNAIYPHHQQHTSWIPPDLPPKLSINIPLSNRQPPVNLPPIDCSVYVNHEMSLATHHHHQPKISNTQQQSDLYGACTAAQCSDQMNNNASTGYATTDQILWAQPPSDVTNQFAQPVVDHYQFPMINNMDAHYNPVQSTPVTCYSTVHCPVSSSIVGYGIQPATPQFRPPSRHQMVPTSDAGDAYFESNYGTLISRSSAYKTLGYVTSSQTTHTNSMSTSSSPNSFLGAPPTNINNNNTQGIASLNSQDIHVHRSPDLRFSKRANGYVDLDDTSTGVIVVKNHDIDTGLATHV